MFILLVLAETIPDVLCSWTIWSWLWILQDEETYLEQKIWYTSMFLGNHMKYFYKFRISKETLSSDQELWSTSMHVSRAQYLLRHVYQALLFPRPGALAWGPQLMLSTVGAIQVVQRFQELFSQMKYKEAADLAAESPQGILRTPDTVAKFQVWDCSICYKHAYPFCQSMELMEAWWCLLPINAFYGGQVENALSIVSRPIFCSLLQEFIPKLVLMGFASVVLAFNKGY